jgi:hypothetical protein
MNARFEFVFSCSASEVGASDTRTVRKTNIAFSKRDGTNKDREPKEKKPEEQHIPLPAAEPYTRL